jgi:tRNA (cmo5U34)-methyltransferase
MEAVARWSFDADVAAQFVGHARCHIPAYERVVELSVRVAREHCGPRERIAEIGCATGHTIRKLEAAGFRDIVGVDASRAMLDACAARHARLVHSGRFPVAHGPFRLVLCNWTLHFVAPEERGGYLRELRAGLAAGGLLVLSEKTAQSPFNERLYHDFKRSRGVSEDEIAAKKRRLAGVLETLPLHWYLDTLRALGFDTEVLWAEHGFVTLLARLER